MAVIAEVSVVSAIAGRPGRSRSKRPTISAAKCWLSAAEPPLPQASTLFPLRSACASASPARAMSGASVSATRRLTSMDSSKCVRMCSARFIGAILTRSDLESAALPRGLARLERDDVEAARRLAGELREVMPGRGDDPAALGCGDALECAAEAAARAATNLDEDERRSVAGDEVDLAHARAVVARHDLEAVAGEQPLGLVLGALSGDLRRRAPSGRRRHCVAPLMATTRPLSTSEGVSVRMKLLPAPSTMRPVTPSRGPRGGSG